MNSQNDMFEQIGVAAEKMLASYDPLARLVGEFALVEPRREQTSWTETGYHSFSKDHHAERKLIVGRNLAFQSFQVVMAGTYNDAAVELMLKHDRNGTRFLQQAADIDYHNPLPALADEVRATRQFMAEIQAGTLKPLIN